MVGEDVSYANDLVMRHYTPCKCVAMLRTPELRIMGHESHHGVVSKRARRCEPRGKLHVNVVLRICRTSNPGVGRAEKLLNLAH